MKGQLKIAEAMIKELKKRNHFNSEDISKLTKELSMTKIH